MFPKIIYTINTIYKHEIQALIEYKHKIQVYIHIAHIYIHAAYKHTHIKRKKFQNLTIKCKNFSPALASAKFIAKKNTVLSQHAKLICFGVAV